MENSCSFSSPKQRQILKGERQSADDYLQSKIHSLCFYFMLCIKEQYLAYMTTGVKLLLTL
jgi:hypothetical protein